MQQPTPTAERHPESPWAMAAGDVLDGLGVDPAEGLSAAEASSRQARYGPNQLETAARRPVFAILAAQFRSVVVLLLAVAAGLAVLFGDFAEGAAIFAVVAINAGIGFVTEWRATRSMEALGRLGRVDSTVLRDGVARRVPAEDLVPGDVVVLEGGDVVAADLRLVEAARLTADESALTGESLPIDKQTAPLPADTGLMERSNMAFKGTAMTSGAGKGIVIGTGMHTELGRISNLVIAAETQRTPLEKRLNILGGRLVWVVLVMAAVIAAAGIAAERELFLAIEVAIALAVAAIPEGLPIVATIALARGMWRMAKRNALISRLSAVETLGATSIILTDKTGTLTENRMTVTAIRVAAGELCADPAAPQGFPADAVGRRDDAGREIVELLRIAALCSTASLDVDEEGVRHATGDPTEIALLQAAENAGVRRAKLLEALPEVEQIAFDPALRLMATLHRDKDGVLVAVKGAPESVLERCTRIEAAGGELPLTAGQRQRWLDDAQKLAAQGLRTLAIARRHVAGPDADVYADLALLGLVGMEDPPREGVRQAIDRCRSAGVSVIMVTGDHAATARHIATELDIVDAATPEDGFVDGAALDPLLGAADPRLARVRVFSRVSPEQKLSLIEFYQDRNHVVAMTGDGVNDAPALKRADIGVAMGVRGTAVAKEASAMVLQDDEFRTIVEAVSQGRTIYQNIRKFIVYLLSCNTSEVLVVGLATLAGAPLPLLPLQLLFLNLVTDVFPALALGVGEGPPGLMRRPPRPAAEPMMTRRHWWVTVLSGIVIAATVLAAMAIAILYLEFDADRAVTVSFCTLAFAQLWHVFNMREDLKAVVRNEISGNVWVWGAIALCVLLIVGAIYSEVASRWLRLVEPGTAGWLLIAGTSLVPLVAVPLVRAATGAVFRPPR